MDVKVDDVVQINPETTPTFGGHFMIVTEVKAWGVVGYCRNLGIDDGAKAYFRAPFDKIALIGKARWMF